MGEIVVGGRPVEIGCAVVRDASLTFYSLPRRSQTRSAVLHWTGGEGGGRQVFNVLKSRGLSVQFLVDQLGVVYQYADADLRCAHAGEMNATSVGIEISNRANGKPDDKWSRDSYSESVHGKTFRCSYFLPAQVEAVGKLTRALCKTYDLPFESPEVNTALLPSELKAFRGVLGHLHITRRKVDPGLRLLRELGLRIPV